MDALTTDAQWRDPKAAPLPLAFWLEETPPAQHFVQDAALDAQIAARFGQAHSLATTAELWRWRATPHGRLSEIILLDQFSRNLFRNHARAFAADAMALALAQEALAQNADAALRTEERAFLYMPFMHSESLAIHEEAMRLFSAPGLEDTLQWEIKHRDVLLRFGRYPSRNDALGRTPTPAERTHLAEGGAD